MFVPIREARKLTGLSDNTLRKYADEGKINCIKPNGKTRLFDVASLQQNRKYFAETCNTNKPVVCYCRVSSKKQQDDLVRQVAYMRQQFPEAEIIQDIGSGLNFKRKGLQSILQRLLQGDKFTLIIAYPDRLTRFGNQLFEYMFQQNGGELMVLNKSEVSPEQELTEDLLAILHIFSCRMHGLRRYKSEIEKEYKSTTSESKENQDISD